MFDIQLQDQFQEPFLLQGGKHLLHLNGLLHVLIKHEPLPRVEVLVYSFSNVVASLFDRSSIPF